MITYTSTVSLNIQGEGNPVVLDVQRSYGLDGPERLYFAHNEFQKIIIHFVKHSKITLRGGVIYFGILSYVKVSSATIHLRDLCIHNIFVEFFFCCCHMSRVHQNANILGLDRLSYCINTILTHSYYNIIKSYLSNRFF